MSFTVNGFGDMPNALIGGPAANQAIGSVQGMRLGQTSNGRAVLYLFSPKNMPNQVRRSHLYNFTDEYMHDLDGFIKRTNNPMGSTFVNPALLDSRAAANAVQMSLDGDQLNCNAFGMMWSFLLVIDGAPIAQDPNAMIYQVSFGESPKRFLYSGYCTDEPYNPVNHGQVGITQNPMCCLVITHQTALSSGLNNYGNHPLPTQTNILFNTDEFNPQFLFPLQQPAMNGLGGAPEVYLNKPSLLVDSILDTEGLNPDGTATVSINTQDAMLVPGRDTAINVQAELNGTRKHAASINSVAQNAVLHTTGELEEPSVYLDGGNAIQHNMHSGLLMIENAAMMASPLGNQNVISLLELDQRFPNMEATVCEMPRDSQWDVSNPLAPNAVNLFSSMLSSAIPPIMVNHKLAEIAFRYTSYVPELVQMGSMDRSHYEVYTAATFVPESDERMRFYVTRFIEELKTQVFPTLLIANGHFDVQVYCSSAYTVLVKLHFMDDGVQSINNGMYETSNSLGGAISPLLGNISTFNHNATQMSKLLGAINPAPNLADSFIHSLQF